MNLKYRIRLKNERVIGPFSTEEIGELLLKGHIVGSEMCQQFPIGDWRPLPLFPNLKSLVDEIKASKIPKETPVETGVTKKESTKTNQKKPIEGSSGIRTFTEFKFGKDVKIDIDYAELEKKFQAENPDVPYEDGMEKTRLIRRLPGKVEELEKTVVVKPKFEAPKPEKKEVREVVKVAPIVELKEVVPEPTYEEMVSEATEFINLAQALPTINAQLSVSEVELERQAKIEENQEKKRLRELQEIMLREQAIEDGEEESEVEIIEEYDREKKEFEQKVVIKKKKK